jgi:hypothetical protein
MCVSIYIYIYEARIKKEYTPGILKHAMIDLKSQVFGTAPHQVLWRQADSSAVVPCPNHALVHGPTATP